MTLPNATLGRGVVISDSWPWADQKKCRNRAIFETLTPNIGPLFHFPGTRLRRGILYHQAYDPDCKSQLGWPPLGFNFPPKFEKWWVLALVKWQILGRTKVGLKSHLLVCFCLNNTPEWKFRSRAPYIMDLPPYSGQESFLART